MDTKIKLLGCARAKSHLEVVLEPVVGIVFGVNLYGVVMNPVFTSRAWLERQICTQKSKFYDVREPNYTLKWFRNLLLA